MTTLSKNFFLGGNYISAVAIRKARKLANGYRSPHPS